MITAHIDPTGYHKNMGAKNPALVEACGFIPAFFSEVAMSGAAKDYKEFYKQTVNIYGYGDYSSVSWGTLDSEGVLTSPEGDPEDGPKDPPLHPYVSLTDLGSDTTVYIYPYAIVAFVKHGDNTQSVITRMD